MSPILFNQEAGVFLQKVHQPPYGGINQLKTTQFFSFLFRLSEVPPSTTK